MKVFHIMNEARCSFIINQGLAQLGADFYTDHDFVSLGKVIKRASPISSMTDCDLILTGHAGFQELYDRHNLWDRVFFYEFRDSCAVQESMLKANRYFKRSVSCGPDRTPIKNKNIIPINHCALEEYYREPVEKDINIGCFFDENNHRLGTRRKNLLATLKAQNPPGSLIGVSTAHANPARLAIMKDTAHNPFVDYIEMLHRCKIVFNAQPTPVDGDLRTWEAMCSRALVFRDISYIPTPNALINGVHCIDYDASDLSSIERATKQANYYLDHPDERNKIAMAGFDFVHQHHRALNRVAYMLNFYRKQHISL